MANFDDDTLAIDVVANLWTHENVKLRPDWGSDFFSGKLGQDPGIVQGMTEAEYLHLMDVSGIERAFLPAVKAGPFGHPPGYRTPIKLISDAVHRHPGRARSLHPDGRVTGVARVTVHTEGDHPEALCAQVVEVGLVLGAGDPVVSLKHGVAPAGW